MKIPKKITPDRIRDAIVQVFFISTYPYELLISYVHKVIIDLEYEYIQIQHPSIQPTVNNADGNIITQQISVNLSPIFIDKEHEVRIQLQPNGSINFNIAKNYIGWDRYFQKISLVLDALRNNKITVSYSRVGLRYVSEFNDMDISNKMKFNFGTSFPEWKIKGSATNLRLEVGDKTVILNIALNHPINNPQNPSTQVVSIIDVDVIKEHISITDLSKFLDIINSCHDKQKEIFFSLLTDEFLNELNPEY